MNRIKIILDIVMTLLMIFLMKTNITGLDFHEIIGIFIFILFIIHKVLNFKFIKAIGKNIFSKKVKIDSKVKFWLDVVLLLFMIINVFSGILISRFIFSFINISNVGILTIIHKSFAWWTLILISIHIGLHLDRVSNYLKKKFNVLNNKYVKYFILFIYLVFAIFGVMSLTKYSICSKLIPVNTTVESGKNYKNHKSHEKIQEKEIKEESSDSIDTEEDIPTLDEYLSQFHCDGCRKQCSLANPKCEVGRSKREEKIKEYYEKYGDSQNKDQELKEDKENNKLSMNENKKLKNKSTILDVIYVIILFMGASYYLNSYLNNRKVK